MAQWSACGEACGRWPKLQNRLFAPDQRRRLRDVLEGESEDDDTAIQIVAEHDIGEAMELWQTARELRHQSRPIERSGQRENRQRPSRRAQ
jgi:hypothetical protein